MAPYKSLVIKMKESELVFNKNGVNIRTLSEVPIIGGEKWVSIEQISYDRLSSLSNGLNMTVKSIKPEIKNGMLVELKFQISDFSSIKSQKEETIHHTIFEKAENEQTLPGYRYEYAIRINKLGTQENLIKTTIKEKDRISDVELRNILKNSGYTGDSGAIGATIKVLKDDIKDVNVEGRGEHKTYIWVGETQ